MAISIFAGIGRADFRQQVCRDLVEYFNIEPYKTITLTTDKGGEDQKRLANPLPLLGKFVVDKLDVSSSTFHKWVDTYPEIKQAHDKAKDLQEYVLVTNSLLGLYNARTAVFALKNICNYRDRIEQKLSGELSINNLMNTISNQNSGNDLISQRDSAIDNTE